MEFKERFKGRFNFVKKQGHEQVLLAGESNPVTKEQ